MGKFDERVAIITGSSSGIGRAVAIEMALEGAKIVLHCRIEDKEDLKESVEKLNDLGVPADYVRSVTGYIEESATHHQLVEEALNAFGRIDILINNAGVTRKPNADPFEIDNFDFVMGINLRAPIQLTSVVLPHLKKSHGCVVNVSSVGSTRVMATSQLHYSVSKAGLDAFTRGCVDEFSKDGVRINSVNFGSIRTPMFDKSTQINMAMFLEQAKKKIPLGRMGTPEEAAQVITFLASTDASYVTGANWVVDGGLSTHSSTAEGHQ